MCSLHVSLIQFMGGDSNNQVVYNITVLKPIKPYANWSLLNRVPDMYFIYYLLPKIWTDDTLNLCRAKQFSTYDCFTISCGLTMENTTTCEKNVRCD